MGEIESKLDNEPIGSSARQHLVDANNVVGVYSNSYVEGVLSDSLHKVLVGANASSLKSLAGKLLVLVGDEVDAKREVINICLLATQIEDANLAIGNTTIEARLGIRLVLAVSVATSRTTTHFSSAR